MSAAYVKSSSVSLLPPAVPRVASAWKWRIAVAAGIVGGLLLALNLYGLTRSLRRDDLQSETVLRFPNDLQLSFAETRAQLRRMPGESNVAYGLRATTVVQRGISHIVWDSPAVEKYHLRVPVWENYLLYIASYIRPKEFQRYHFTNPDRTIERGVGICGDAACVLSTALERERIESRILAFPGHVVVEANFGTDEPEWWILDADFGVAVRGDLKTIRRDLGRVLAAYEQAGYGAEDINDLRAIYSQPGARFASAFDFSPKRACLEETLYVLKWALPLALLALSLHLRGKVRL
jgi:predicted nucleic acid-binding protein